MKAIMMSIRPQWVAEILNGEKTIEIRKKFPKDYVGWVYIYCTKDNELLCQIDNEWNTIKVVRGAKLKSIYNGKVVARFWCDKVEEISYNYRNDFTSVYTDTLDTEDLEEQACLTRQEFAKYLKGDYGYAIHITNLEIFDKPKELYEFKTKHFKKIIENETQCLTKRLTRAPESWCYVEV